MFIFVQKQSLNTFHQVQQSIAGWCSLTAVKPVPILKYLQQEKEIPQLVYNTGLCLWFWFGGGVGKVKEK